MTEVIFRNVGSKRCKVRAQIVDTIDDNVRGGSFVEGWSAPVGAKIAVFA